MSGETRLLWETIAHLERRISALEKSRELTLETISEIEDAAHDNVEEFVAELRARVEGSIP
jgi:hypothetical protein